MKKVVVTGALGFIGFALCERLLERGIEVIGIDGMIDDNLHELYEEKQLLVGRNSLFHLIKSKIEDVHLVELLESVHATYHLAAVTSKEQKWEGLRKTIDDNVGVTERIINACKKTTKIIFISTLQVYGERSGIVTEKTPLNPTTPYSITKMAAESLIRSKCREKEIPFVIFRLPTIYGPWQRTDMTYHQCIKNDRYEIKKSDYDRVTEDVLYIDDILDTLIDAGTRTDCQSEIYNLSTGKINEWFRGLEMICNDVTIRPTDERMFVSINNEKVVTELGFQVKTSLEKGIKAQKAHIEKYKHLYVNI